MDQQATGIGTGHSSSPVASAGSSEALTVPSYLSHLCQALQPLEHPKLPRHLMLSARKRLLPGSATGHQALLLSLTKGQQVFQLVSGPGFPAGVQRS